MAYRDVLFEPLVSVFLLAGLSRSTIESLPDAMRTVVTERSAARRRWPGPVLRARFSSRSRAQALVPRSLHEADEALSDAQLIAAAHSSGLRGLPFAVTTSGDRCVVAVAHAVYDGTGSLELIHDLLEAASGLPLPREQEAARLPVLSALRQVRPRDVKHFVDARLHRVRGAVAVPTDVPPQRTSTATLALEPDDLAAIRRYREATRAGRPTLLSRIAGLTIAALREVQIGDGDIPVWMTADLRHLVDGRVDGNFIGREQIGTLRGDQWAPGWLAARLVQMKGPGQALSLVWSTTGWLIRGAIGRRPAEGEEIVLTLASTRRGFAVPVRAALATSVGGSPTFGFAWQNKSGVYVSVHNASGRFDLDRFEEVFRRIVRERADG